MFSGIDNLGLFIVAGILLNLTPGPDVLYTVTHAVKSGWRAGAVAALGITAGCFVHIAAAALGVSALMATSSTAFWVLKWLGAAYLVYLGWTLLGASTQSNTPDSIAASAISVRARGHYDPKSIFVQGFWTNALNPKVALFFLAFLPQFIAQGAEHKTLAFLVLGLVFNVNGLVVNLGYAAVGAALGAAVSSRFATLQRGMVWLQRTAGVLFIGFGLKLALTDNQMP